MRKMTSFLRPFKLLQTQLGILEEWNLFKKTIWQNKFRFIFFSSLFSFPVYNRYLDSQYQVKDDRVLESINQHLRPDQPASKFFQETLEQTMEKTFKSDEVKREAVVYIEALAKNEKIIDGVLHLLNQAVQSQEVKEEAKLVGEDVALRILEDPGIKKDIGNLVGRSIRDPEVKSELMETIRWVFYQKETKDALVYLLGKSFEQEEMRQALAKSLSTSLLKVCSEPETSEAMKEFMLQVLQTKIGSQDPSLIDMVLEKIKKKPRGLERDFKRRGLQFDPFNIRRPIMSPMPRPEKYY